MKIIDCQQYSDKWWEVRLGIPTASRFDSIITKTGKQSTASVKYMNELLAAYLLGHPLEQFATDLMARGSSLEQDAANLYAFAHDVDVVQTGFVLTDDGRIGCSPDRLIGKDGGLEIKTPQPAVHVGYLLGNIADEYKQQLQGCLYVCEREWWDIVSYNPDMPRAEIRVYRDEEYINTLAIYLIEFCDELWEKKQQLSRLIEEDSAKAFDDMITGVVNN